MNLQSEISPTIPTLSMMQPVICLNVIKEKSGVEDDGAGLVGQALGGAAFPNFNSINYKLNQRKWNRRVSRHIKGIYSAIRSPRSHERSSAHALGISFGSIS